MRKITCSGCGWKWDLSDGGNDPYICHKCGNDNEDNYVTKIRINNEDYQYLKETIKSGKILTENLSRWFREKWVDVSKKIDGKHPPCGRKSADGEKGRKGYPKCRPQKKVSKETPKTASSYSKEEKKSMTSQKRRAERKEPKTGKGNDPTFTKYDKNEIINEIAVNYWDIYDTYDPPTLKNINESNITISEGLNYHITKKKPLIENVFRVYSNEFFNLFNESRELFERGILEVHGEDYDLLMTDIGKTGVFEGEEVFLDVPFILNEEEHLIEVKHRGKNVKLNKPFRTPGGPKKFAVYVKTPSGNIKKVTFGDPNLRVRNNNKKAAKSFRARHKCDQKKDRTTAGYWSCNLSRYRKSLGIKSSRSW
jgi:hypothetical protein